MSTSRTYFSKGAIIKDNRPLSFDYVPESLPFREDKLRDLSIKYRPLLFSGIPTNVAITGPVGTGKTVVARRFSQLLKEVAIEAEICIKDVYVNCRQRKTDSMVLLGVVNRFDEHFPDRGFSKQEMLRIIKKHMIKSRCHLLIILDEADVLLKKSGSDLIYSFTRFQEEQDCPFSVSTMLISQKNPLDFLDPSTLSTFKRTNLLRFDKYDREALKGIVEQRIELALYPGSVDLEVPDLIADMSEETGDARFAIELLGRAAEIAEERGEELVTPEHARAAKAYTKPYIYEDIVDSLNIHQQIQLLAAARLLRKKAYTTTGEVEREYSVICEELSKKPLGHTQFWQYLKELDAQGLITTRRSGKGVVGNTTQITIADIPAEEIIRYLEKRLLSK
ncbi:MAG: orc1/cdc6 family replication initiation protein [Thermoplasmata archaeon]|nr:MAG: orc1/cdc6 family replication initiation protein [Thermoplasmata archaeon]